MALTLPKIDSARTAAIVLCGGQSSRMGCPKGLLPFGPELLLQRMVRIVREVTPTIVVVAAEGQGLPPLEGEVIVARDLRPARGPLEGLAAGLAALPPEIEAAYATGCDTPLLRADWVRQMFAELGDFEIAVPRDNRFYHPLAAVYRRAVLPRIEKLLGENRLRPFFLFEEAKTREVPVEELRGVDPQLESLENLNHLEDYEAALARFGWSLPPDIAAKLRR